VRRVLVQGHTRRPPVFDFGGAALAAFEAHSDPAALRIRDADRRAREAGDDAVRAAAADEARRLRLDRLGSLVELGGWASPPELALAVVAWARAGGLPDGPVDELIAALAALKVRNEEEADHG
jgi:hypothetical protein